MSIRVNDALAQLLRHLSLVPYAQTDACVARLTQLRRYKFQD